MYEHVQCSLKRENLGQNLYRDITLCGIHYTVRNVIECVLYTACTVD